VRERAAGEVFDEAFEDAGGGGGVALAGEGLG